MPLTPPQAVKFLEGNPTVTPDNFEVKEQIIITGNPTRIFTLADNNTVKRIEGSELANLAYWKSAGLLNGTVAKTIYVQPTDPALDGPVENGSIWMRY